MSANWKAKEIILNYSSLNVSFYIAKKYFLVKRRSNAANFINYIALTGIVVGSMALFIILSAFSGLEITMLDIFSKERAILKVESKQGKRITITQDLLDRLNEIPQVLTVGTMIEEKVQAVHQGKGQFVYLQGLDSITLKNIEEYPISGNVDSLALTDFLGQEDELILSYKAAEMLEVKVLANWRDSVEFYVPKVGRISLNKPAEAYHKRAAFTIGILFGNDEPIAFVPIAFAQSLLGLKPQEVYALQITHDQSLDNKTIQQKVQQVLGSNYRVLTQEDQLGALHSMMKTENIMVYLVFTLILIISAFNLVGAIIILIIEKKNDIATLACLGMSSRQIKRIFLLEGLLVTGIGGSIGFGLAIAIILMQQQFKFIMINAFKEYPIEITLTNIIITISTILTIGYIASISATLKLKK